ncbi:hypothetical protein V2I01_04780 [Micromonospora sp. BRA006-A]|nr:hypothetical protein [Micromonospora sp. BRA006-A]
MSGGRLVTATSAKSGSTVTAVVNGVSTTVQVARDLTVAAGDVLLVERVGAQWFAYARVFASAPTRRRTTTLRHRSRPSRRAR